MTSKKDPAFEKGLIFEAQELVIEALEERFGFVSEEIKKRIKAIEDRTTLKGLHRLAIRVKDLEEFMNGLPGREDNSNERVLTAAILL